MKSLKFTGMVVALAALSGSAMAAVYVAPDPITVAGYTFNVPTDSDGLDFKDTFKFSLASGAGSTVKFDVTYLDYGDDQFALPKVLFKLNNETEMVDFGGIKPGAGLLSSTLSFSGLSIGTPYSLDVEVLGGGVNTDYGSWNFGNEYSVTVAAASVPEPDTYALILSGLAILATVSRRRTQKA